MCFDTGSPAKVTSTVDGRNNAIGEALRQAQGDWKEEGGMNPAPASNCRDGRPHRVAPTLECRITEGVSRYAPTSDKEPLTLPSPSRGEGQVPFGSAFFSTLGNSIFA